MPLIVNTRKCTDHDKFTDSTRFVLGTTAMQVGMHEVTEKNIPEWLARIAVLNQFGDHFVAGGKNLTARQMRMFIGATINVVPETRSQFLSKYRKRLAELMDQTAKNYGKQHARTGR